jgi:hypothetical protein
LVEVPTHDEATLVLVVTGWLDAFAQDHTHAIRRDPSRLP